MDKEDVVCTYNGTLFNHEKEGIPPSWNNMDGSGGHYVKWNKPEEYKNFMVSLIHGTCKISQTHETQSRKVVSRGWQKGTNFQV